MSVDVPTVLAHKLPDCVTTYTERDAALYALTVGVAEDALDAEDLPLVYELCGDGFRVMPTFAVVFPFAGMAGLTDTPGLSFNPMMLLHGEQELHLKGALPPSGTITSKLKIAGVYDKGKGALIHLDSHSYDESGTEVCYQRSSIFIRGIGGFGGDRGPKAEPWVAPNRAPDNVAKYRTAANQALTYRLNGDTNPLHADPGMAAMGGFDKPILHGLCSFGVAARAILKKYCANDVDKFKSIKARFAKHVFPGETVVTESWVEGGKVLFRCTVPERDVVVLSNGVATVEGLGGAAAGGGAGGGAGASAAASGSKSAPFFEQIKAAVAADGASFVKKVRAVIQYKLTNPDSAWVVDLKNGSGAVSSGMYSGKADLTVTVSEDDFVALATQKLNPQQAFMKGKIKVKGNMSVAMKLGEVLKAAAPKSKL